MAQQETYGNWLGPPPLPAKRLVRQAGKNRGENTFILGGFGGGRGPGEAGRCWVAQEGSAGGGSRAKGVGMRGVTRVPLSAEKAPKSPGFHLISHTQTPRRMLKKHQRHPRQQ